MATLYAIVKVDTPDLPGEMRDGQFKYGLTPDSLASAIRDGLDSDNYYKEVDRAIIVVTGNRELQEVIDQTELFPLSVQTIESAK